MKHFAAILLLARSVSAFASQPVPTVRVDHFHTGNADTDMYSLHQVVIEPLPWHRL